MAALCSLRGLALTLDSNTNYVITDEFQKQRWNESGALKYHKHTIEYGAARAAMFQAVVVVVGGQVCDSVMCSYVAVGSLQTRKVKDGLSSEAPCSTLPGPC